MRKWQARITWICEWCFFIKCQRRLGKIKIAQVVPTTFEPVRTFGNFGQFSTNKESLSENQSYILVTEVMLGKLREWHELFLLKRIISIKLIFFFFLPELRKLNAAVNLEPEKCVTPRSALPRHTVLPWYGFDFLTVIFFKVHVNILHINPLVFTRFSFQHDVD